ncbi:cobyric acid synthase [Leeia sp. TBRC 13508]|uniref:Cobyric acid synthase n=1 Tax=Leeia speluncae TaxID=2884804 RepID=A0ABS8D2Z4_9NEIS|nr:cobyric acid synthase [Leeia speluncae]MCB6182556.1 cobyric acid synthase [Leeia speluncae]
MPTIMIQGCTSDAGKSTMVAALCRVLAKHSLRVTPFKPQNMALNSAVTIDGGEIGRAQAFQALAAGIPAHSDQNPVLLKPTSDCMAQVIIQGKVLGNLNAIDYHEYKKTAKNAVMDSWQRLSSLFDWVAVEGAGSPAEVNLREGDIANMGFAEEVDCPVWLVADIDRGGVFAHIIGTLACLSESEQARIQGFIINRFRGDIALLEPGITWLEEKTNKPVLAVIPYLHGLTIAAEDAIQTEHQGDGKFRILVLTLPHISNHTDFDPLRLHPEVTLTFSTPEQPLPSADLIIIPGSKNTRSDLAWLKHFHYDAAITRHLRYGGKVIGICGGYQMLGEWVDDPSDIEGELGRSAGLCFLPIGTTLHPVKQLKEVQGTLTLLNERVPVKGYEIHQGISQILESGTQQIIENTVDQSYIGCLSKDEMILGTYLHGVFDDPNACQLLLKWAGLNASVQPSIDTLYEQAIERLSTAFETAFEERQRGSLLTYLTGE